MQCAERAGADFAAIETCAVSEEGDRLLAKYGQRTIDLEPVLTYVPTVIVNGVSIMVNYTLVDNRINCP